MSYTTRASLLQRVAEGIDPAAWAEFHRRYAELIGGFARRQGLAPADQDDAVQDVLLALLKAMPGFRYDPGKGRFRSYLKTVTVRAVQRRRQAQQPADGRVEPVADVDAAVGGADAAEGLWDEEWRRHHIRRAMARIQPEFGVENRQAFTLYAIQGRSAEQTAELLGISIDQVYQARSRILRRLRQVIDEQVEAEGSPPGRQGRAAGSRQEPARRR